jgi:lipopolysaccharide export system permease protein
LGPPLLALAFALLAVPLGRSSPRQTRYGRVMLGFLAYLVGMNLMWIGTGWLEKGKLPLAAGLWWLLLPLLAFAAWVYLRDGRPGRARPRRAAPAGGAA